jgi:TRAP-type C4-dicarboxylate transport system permease large subunit
MIAIMVLTMVVGTAMDMTPTILILTPVLMPIVKAAGIDPVYFGVLFMINNAIGLITPPVGTVLSTVAGVGKVSMDEVTKGVWPFMVAQFAVMFLMVFFPQLVMVPARWLGHRVRRRPRRACRRSTPDRVPSRGSSRWRASASSSPRPRASTATNSG